MTLQLAYFAILVILGSALISVFADQMPSLLRTAAFVLLGVGSIAAIVSGVSTLISGSSFSATLPFGLPWLNWHVRLDALSGFFFALIGVITFAISLYGPGYVREFEHGKQPLSVLGIFTGLFIVGMLLVVIADDAFMFMVAWELMSLSSYFLVAYQHDRAANRRAAFLYLLMAHVSGLSILLGFGVLASFSGSFAFDILRATEIPALWATIAFTLTFFGFGMKAGLVPLHAWLPEAHPVAPSHISALMSGVMLKVAVYGFIRMTFDLLGDIHWGWGVAVLIIASVSALMGVLYALMQHNLKRLLAYHSVENIGIIFIGLGLAMVFMGTGHKVLGVLGLIAALYHTLNHALFKSLLFLGAGAVIHSSHEKDLEQMGGLLKRMPWTGLFFLIGCISISALPPFNGFVSEWLTFQTALQAWKLENGILRTIIPLSAAMLALTGTLAAYCFVKVYGIAFLGLPRSRHVRRAREVGMGMRLAQGMLAVLCLLFGILPTHFVGVINSIPIQLVGVGLPEISAHGWMWLTPINADTASYGAPLVLIAIAVAWFLLTLVLRRGKKHTVHDCEPWDCGFSTPDSRMQYTATAFSMPIRRVFGLLFHIDEQVERNNNTIKHRLTVTDRAWDLFYKPIADAVHKAARQVSRMQSGNVRIYLGWSLGTLLVLLWLIT